MRIKIEKPKVRIVTPKHRRTKTVPNKKKVQSKNKCRKNMS